MTTHPIGRGLPGLRGTDHIGFTVPDVDQAVAFFVDVLGCEAFYELGLFASDGDWMATHLNVHPRAVMKKLRFLRCGNGSNFEIFEYAAPDQNRTPPRNSDVGGHHLASHASTTSTPRWPTCVRSACASWASRRCARAARARARPGCSIPSRPGHAARTRELPRWQGLREDDCGAAVASGPPRTLTKERGVTVSIDILMPAGTSEATLTRWAKRPGDALEKGDVLAQDPD